MMIELPEESDTDDLGADTAGKDTAKSASVTPKKTAALTNDLGRSGMRVHFPHDAVTDRSEDETPLKLQ